VCEREKARGEQSAWMSGGMASGINEKE